MEVEWCKEGEWADEAVMPRNLAEPGVGGTAAPRLLELLELRSSTALVKVGEGLPESGRLCGLHHCSLRMLGELVFEARRAGDTFPLEKSSSIGIARASGDVAGGKNWSDSFRGGTPDFIVVGVRPPKAQASSAAGSSRKNSVVL